MKPAKDPRRAYMAAIHAKAKELRLDEETRRALQQRVAGKASCADMDAPQLRAVLDELHRLEGKAEHVARGFDVHRDEPKDLSRPMLKKTQALLSEGRKPWAYVHAMAKRMFSVTRVEWLRDDQLHKLVAALNASARRQVKPRRG